MIATAPDYVAACRAIVAQLSTTGPHAEAALLRTLPADERDVRAWMVCYAKLALVFMPGAEAAAPWWAFLRRVHDRAPIDDLNPPVHPLTGPIGRYARRQAQRAAHLSPSRPTQ